MTDPISYSFATPRLNLPLLFSGQSQKEVTVNEALWSLDLLLPGAVDGVLSAPPTTPVEGGSWIVGTGPTGVFAGRTGQIAGWSDNGWRFVQPTEGLRVFNRNTAAICTFLGGWTSVQAPSMPTGGTVIDVQARASLAMLLTALIQSGVISAN